MQKLRQFVSFRPILALAISAILIASLFFLFREYGILREVGIFERPPMRRELPRKITVEDIQPWMTFDYLKNALNITDPRYPNIPVGSFSKRQKMDPRDAVEKIKQLISEN